ncbi:MAG: DUF2470 domain-containing protein [Pseudonocardiales bacterium]|nr:DUF2470 domain-containing protein [Pseudonocardiales bacterium]
MPPAHPDLYRLAPDGSAALLLADEHPLHAAVEMTPSGDLAAMVEVADIAPVPLRQPVRGLLWISGWLQALAPEDARSAALWIAEKHPSERLLDLGHCASIVWLRPAFVVLADADGTAILGPGDIEQASPDPLRTLEAEWLRHLDHRHPDLLEELAGKTADSHRRGGRQRRVRPLGVDRLGLRLRVEDADRDRDVRLAFERPADQPAQLAMELSRLAGGPRLTG